MEAGQETHSQDDRTLVAEFKRSGDVAALGPLFERHGRRLYAVAYRVLREVGLAEECVQETFYRALMAIHQFDESAEDANVWAWLVTIVKHVCLDEIRKGSRRGRGEPPGEQLLRAKEASPEQEVLLGEIREAILRLPPENRLCFLLLHVEGYSYREIVSLTGYPYHQVKTHVQTAKRHLQRMFRGAR